MDSNKIGSLICEERGKLGLTQEALANKLFVTRSLVSKWERGISLPSCEYLPHLCDIFNITSNELLAGERLSTENSEYVGNITLEVLEEEKKKRKWLVIRFGIICFMMLFGFLGYYFFMTYKRTELYILSGVSENFKMDQSLAFISNETTYLMFLYPESRLYECEEIDIYYMKDGERKNMMSTNSGDTLIIQDNGYDEYFDSKDREVMLNNLYVDVKYNDGEKILFETIKIEINRVYNNKRLFFRNDESISTGEDLIVEEVPVPKKIEEKFELKEDGNYYLNYKKDGKKINLLYMTLSDTFFVFEDKDNMEEKFILSSYGYIDYYLIFDNIEVKVEAKINNDEIICDIETNDDEGIKLCEKNKDKFLYFIKEYGEYFEM